MVNGWPAEPLVFAGGVCAADGYNSYCVIVEFGRYDVVPVSSEHDVSRHLGYRVYFVNDKGSLAGGLWQQLANLVSLPQARRLCRDHFVSTGLALAGVYNDCA